MNKLISLFIVLSFIFCATNVLSLNLNLMNTKTEIYFSPKGGCENAVIAAIGLAKKSIYVQAYTLSSDPISNALVNAFLKKVIVEVILDKSSIAEQYDDKTILVKGGVTVYVDKKERIAHNKVMIIDDNILITGSYNFTTGADKYNAENLLIFNNKALVKIYLNNWNLHKAHSTLYKLQ